MSCAEGSNQQTMQLRAPSPVFPFLAFLLLPAATVVAVLLDSMPIIAVGRLKKSFALVAVSFLIITGAYSQELEVTRKGENSYDDGLKLEIINVDTRPVTIARITINDRPDCILRNKAQVLNLHIRLAQGQAPDPANDQFKGGTFAIGDKMTYTGKCRIIRATIETDLGSRTYSFRGD